MTDINERTMRLAFVELSFLMGGAISLWVGGLLYTTAGYLAVYIISLAVLASAIGYAVFILEESNPRRRSCRDKSQSRRGLCHPYGVRDIFSLNNFRRSVEAVTRRRPRGARSVVTGVIAVFALEEFIVRLGRLIDTSYVRGKFSWDSGDEFLRWMTAFQSVTYAYNFITVGGVTPALTRKLNVRDIVIVIMGSIGGIGKFCAYLSVEEAVFMYAGLVADVFGMSIKVCVRAILSKTVDGDEIGRVFGCLAAIQAVIGMISPLISTIFSYTLAWHIGFLYCVGCVIFMVMNLVGCCVGVKQKKIERYITEDVIVKDENVVITNWKYISQHL